MTWSLQAAPGVVKARCTDILITKVQDEGDGGDAALDIEEM